MHHHDSERGSFAEILTWLVTRARWIVASQSGERSWSVTRAEIEAVLYDLKAVNPNAKDTGDSRTPAELLDLIEAKAGTLHQALAVAGAYARRL